MMTNQKQKRCNITMTFVDFINFFFVHAIWRDRILDWPKNTKAYLVVDCHPLLLMHFKKKVLAKRKDKNEYGNRLDRMPDGF